jgi:hypothetical protein
MSNVATESLSVDQVAEAVKLYGSGLSLVRVGEMLQLNSGTVWQALKRGGAVAGLPRQEAIRITGAHVSNRERPVRCRLVQSPTRIADQVLNAATRPRPLLSVPGSELNLGALARSPHDLVSHLDHPDIVREEPAYLSARSWCIVGL